MSAPPAPSPTPHPAVNALLRRTLGEARAVLGDRFVGLYLRGSLASGDFDPGSSDIDVLVVVAGPLPDATLAALAAMHERLAASGLPYARKLEGSSIPRDALRRHDPAAANHPTIGVDWPFGVAPHKDDWVIERAIVRERGVVVAGPPPQDLIDPVSPDEFRAAVRAMLSASGPNNSTAPTGSARATTRPSPS